MTPERLEELADIAEQGARAAGQSLLSFYRKSIDFCFKQDGSPLTMADKASHDLLTAVLELTGIPVISEEGTERQASEQCYWLIDPLDGTKDFLAANDEFAVNIALMDSNKPVMGIVYAPALKEIYVGNTVSGTCIRKKETVELPVQNAKTEKLRMAVSRFHNHEDASVFAENNKVNDFVRIGSALKFGRLAFGEVDIYPRLVGTSEWDTAAGQAVLESAGGAVLDWHTGLPMQYGKANRRNGRFIAMRSPYIFTDFIYQYFKPETL